MRRLKLITLGLAFAPALSFSQTPPTLPTWKDKAGFVQQTTGVVVQGADGATAPSGSSTDPIFTQPSATGTSTVKIDQTTPGTTNGVVVNSGAVSATQSGTWTFNLGSAIPTGANSIGTVGLNAGSNTIGSIANTTFGATQSGAWNITNITGTVSLPTGAATSANQVATGASAQTMQGSVAAGSSAAGNPVPIGGNALSAAPTATTAGLRVNAWYNLLGSQAVFLSSPTTGTTPGIGAGADAVARTAAVGLQTLAACQYYDGSTNLNLCRGDTNGAYTVPTPTTASTNAVAGISSPSVEGGRVLKASAGNLYRVVVTTGGTAGYLMVFNATTVPADGAVTPGICRAVAANSTLSVSVADMPISWSTGITAVFSSTGCFTKTVSATAFFEGYVK